MYIFLFTIVVAKSVKNEDQTNNLKSENFKNIMKQGDIHYGHGEYDDVCLIILVVGY